MLPFRYLWAALPLMALARGFQLYPLIPTETMAEMLSLSPNCVSALNTTLSCDNDLFQWAIEVDNIYWALENVTKLCTAACISEARLWKDSVDEICYDEYLKVGDRIVPAETLSSRFTEGLEMACMKSSSNQWCLLESYDWVGSDALQIDCAANPSHPTCSASGNTTTENTRISTLYEDELLCSECFLKIFHARVTSDFLPDTDHSEYLVDEFQDIQAVCQTTVGELVTRAIPNYAHITEHPDATSSTTTSTAATPTATVCTGQEVDVQVAGGNGIEACNYLALEYGVATGSLMIASGSEECYSLGLVCVPKSCRLLKVNEGDTCKSLAASASNATNTISVAQLSTWNPNILGACDFLVKDQYVCTDVPGGSWVAPPEDEIPDNSEGPVRGGPGSTTSLPIIENPDVPPELVQEGIAANCIRYIVANSTAASCWKISNDGKVTQARLFELNPILGGHGEYCGTMVWLKYAYCVATSSDNPPTTSVPSSTTSSATTSTSSPKPTATREGIAANCNKWAMAVSGVGCWDMANNAGIDLSLFYAWNTILGPAGENCGTQIWPDYYYCIGVSATSTTQAPTTTSSPTTSSTVPKPTNTQAGIPSNCARFYEAKSGDGCWQIANDNGIELSLFYSWNPVLGASGENCGTQIWPTYYYCIGLSATSTTQAPTTTSSTAPKPTSTQAGIPSSCTRFYEAKSGDGCWQIANDNAIALTLFYSLNPVLGASGENCGTMLWPGYFYCIATS